MPSSRSLLPRNPAQAVALGFVLAILAGTGLLMIPAATAGPGGAPFHVALFTATSAICVTGLTVVDTATYWGDLGQGLIAAEIHLGGFGILTSAALLVLVIGRRMGVRASLVAQTEAHALNLSDVRRVAIGVAVVSVTVEVLAAAVLAARFAISYDMSIGQALWEGAFHAISAFNNAGFALSTDSLESLATDGWVMVTVALTLILGGLGLPVWLDLRDGRRRPYGWSLHTKLTLSATAALLVAGTVLVTALEWDNANTLGEHSPAGRMLVGFFSAVTPRTAGFNAIDYADARPETLFLTDIFMFVGGGSGSTAGGVKVATIAVLALMVFSEMRGRNDVSAFGRRIPGAAQRQALSVVILAITVVVASTLLFMSFTRYRLTESLFEVVSAFGTVGLSTGITPDLPGSAQGLLIALMFIGRVGPLTLGVALVMRERRPLFSYPEERPIVG